MYLVRLTDIHPTPWQQEALMVSRRAGVVVGVLRRTSPLLGLMALLAFAAPASAEWFGDLYLGGAFTSTHDVDTNFPTTGGLVTTQDVTFDSSFAGGFRGGYWFPFALGPLNFGVGLDVSHFAPNVSRQTRTFCNSVCVSGEFDDFDLSVWVIGFDAMLRYPLMKSAQFPNGQLQPYVTLGPAIFRAHAEDSTNFEPSNQSDTDTSVGVKVGVGAAWQFTKNIAAFGEYRFTHFSPEFTFRDDVLGKATVSTDINTHYLLGGVSFRF
jgi:opacity protein-like surface antigen